jgi:integrase
MEMSSFRDRPHSNGRKHLPGFRRPTELLTRQEVLRLISACGKGPSGRRNAALLALAYSGGFRAAELCGLELDDVDRDRAQAAERGFLIVRVRPEIAKGGRERAVGITLDALPLLDTWIEIRRRLGIRSRLLFCTIAAPNRGAPLDTSYLRRLLPRLARRAGVERRVHPHALRATMATEMVREGVPLSTVQAQLGHASIVTTAVYIKRLTPEVALAPLATRTGWGNAA